jgi:Protein of unknown function (DUF1236)
MASRTWGPALMVLALCFGTAGARAQTVGPDEAVKPDGAVGQQMALTAAQKSAIYNAVMRQRVRTAGAVIPVAVGAPVPQWAVLAELPDAAAGNNPAAALLKYALVEDDIVVVDPVQMRVVDIIHGAARP